MANPRIIPITKEIAQSVIEEAGSIVKKGKTKKIETLLEKKSIQKGITKDHYKFSTHPIYKQRYDIINLTKQNSLPLKIGENDLTMIY